MTTTTRTTLAISIWISLLIPALAFGYGEDCTFLRHEGDKVFSQVKLPVDLSTSLVMCITFEHDKGDGTHRDFANKGDATDGGTAPVITGAPNGYADFGTESQQRVTVVSDRADLSFGDGSDDVPFSCVATLYKASSSKDACVMVKGALGDAYKAPVEWKFTTRNADGWEFGICDYSSSGISTSDSGENDGAVRWWHVVGTYDGRGGANAEDGFNLYLNGGANQSSGKDLNAGYVAMEPSAEDLYIGVTGWYFGFTWTYHRGYLADVMIFDVELDTDQKNFLYNHRRF